MNTAKLGCVLDNWPMAFRQALPQLTQWSVQGVQLPAAGELTPKQLGTTARREIRTLLKSYQLDLAAMSCPLRHSLDTFENQQPRIDQISEVMQLAYELGTKNVVVPMPKVPVEKANDEAETDGPKPYLFFTNATPPKATTLRETLEALSQRADKIGVNLCLEAGLDDGGTLKSYLQTFDTGTLQVVFDPANFLVNGHDPVTSAMALSSMTALCHARDARRTSPSTGPEEVVVGQGDCDWITLIAVLESVEFRGYWCVERSQGANRPADVAKSVKYLRRYVPLPTGY